MNPILKYLLFPLLLLLTALPVQAEEKSWYEIDGIKFRTGDLNNRLGFKWGEDRIITTDDYYAHLSNDRIFPVALTLPENLMSSWSFRGAVLEFRPKAEDTDLVPVDANKDGRKSGDDIYLRQLDALRTSLYNNFFNASDKSFADANSNWALSADITGSNIFLGYLWGVFIPIGENHRFIKLGAGLGILYMELSYKLNLCSEYKLRFPTVEKQEAGGFTTTDRGKASGTCFGKTEIDSASTKGFGVGFAGHFTLWERVTKDSIWKIVSTGAGMNLTKIGGNLKNHHDKNLNVILESSAPDSISYTYRF